MGRDMTTSMSPSVMAPGREARPRHPLFRRDGGPTAPDAMPHVVSAERHSELHHLAITRCVTDRRGRGRGRTGEVLVLSRQEIATDLRGPSGAAEQAHVPVSG